MNRDADWLDEKIDFITHAASKPSREVNADWWFQTDAMAPEQYQQTASRKFFLEPEQQLMFAVLEDAICCFQRYASARDKTRTRLFLEAKDWLMEEDGDWPFSFANVCEALGLSHQYIRAGLLRRTDIKSANGSKGKIYQFTAARPRKKRAARRQSVRGFYAQSWTAPNESRT